MSYRLLNYMVEIWRKCEINRDKNKNFSLPKIIPCVLYKGRTKWTSPIEFRELYDDVKEDEDYLVNFKYLLIDIYRYKAEDLLNTSNIISSAFYLDTSTKRNMETRLINLAESLKDASKKEIEIFKRWALSVFIIDDEKRKIIEEKFIKGEESMENLARIAQSIYKDGVKEGRTTGREEGRIEGKMEGIVIGIHEAKVASIKRLLKKKLKSEPEEKVNLLIEGASLDELDKIEDKIFEINSWSEIERI